MNIKSPFSLYDFIGYFFPGVIAICIFLLYIIIRYNVDCDFFLNDKISFSSEKKIIVINGYAHIYFLLIIASYIVGHLISYLSSITIEKYSNWMYGYPSYFLFNKLKPKYYKFYSKEEVNLWIEESHNNFLFMLLQKIRLVFLKSKFKFINYFALIRIRAFFWRFILKITILPITLLDLVIGRLLGLRYYYTNQIDSTLSDFINKKIKNFNLINNIDCTEYDFQRIINHYYYEKYDRHQLRLDNYVSLFGFLRSLSFIFSTTSFLFIFLNPWITLIFAIIAYILYMAFMKFYRKFTMENYMCLLVDEKWAKLIL